MYSGRKLPEKEEQKVFLFPSPGDARPYTNSLSINLAENGLFLS